MEVRPLDGVQDVADYDAVVIGSAIHGGKWLPAAAEFMRRDARALADRPVWLFSVSTLGEDSSAFPAAVARRMRAMRKETAEIADYRHSVGVRDHHDFAGAIERDQWPLPARAFMKAMGGRYGDHRNWPEIDAWAEGIANQLAAIAPGTRAR